MGELRQGGRNKDRLNSLKSGLNKQGNNLSGCFKGTAVGSFFNNDDEVASKVKAIIVDKLTVDENEVTPTAEFTRDLGADSLDAIELIMEFEKEFGITIPDEDAERITTVRDAVLYIQTHV